MNKTNLSIAKTLASSVALATGIFLVSLPSTALAQHGHTQTGHAGHAQGSSGADSMSGMHSMKMGTTAMQKLKRLKGKQFDVAFLSQMIKHHQAALTMARDARPTLKDEHVREHAQNIVTSQTKEIGEMTALLRADYKSKPSAAQMILMEADMKGMMSMKASGDRMFLEMMIPHHQGAVDMSRLALTNGANPKAKALANRIIKEQSAEIADFQSLLKHGVGKGEAHAH